ncbi:Eukaryotic translation initiation factor 2-alpha kinase [Mortierella claussenii]|nr:Eukaryotic translation initiation factor 2-alpha kinase [Mortierella claussenii]
MLKTPFMADKTAEDPSNDRSPTDIPPWPVRASSTLSSSRIRVDPSGMSIRLGRGAQVVELAQAPLSSLPRTSERRERKLMRNTTVMTIHSDSEPEYEDVASPHLVHSSPKRRERKVMRSTTVMTIHSDSEPDLDYSFSTLSPSRKGRRLVRNTTVMTLPSDSDLDLDNAKESLSLRSGLKSLDEGATIIFDNGLSSITTDGVGSTHVGIDTRRSSRNNKKKTGAYSRMKCFPWIESEESKDGSEQESPDDGRHMEPAEMFTQPNDIDHDDLDDEEEEPESEDEDDYGEGLTDNEHDDLDNDRRGFESALDNYLLAPMDFEDDENMASLPGVEGYLEAAERFQIFAGVNEFDESDQIGYGDQAYKVISKSKRRDQERTQENKRRQGKLLLVSLLDNFCLLYDQSPERNRKLFYVICKTLSNMGIIDEEYLEEMSAVRSSYQRAFRSLVLSALTSIKQEQMILESRRIMAPPSTPIGNPDGRRGSRASDLSSSDSTQSFSDSFSSRGIVPSAYLHTSLIHDSAFGPSTAMMRTMSFGDMFDNDPTRYKHDFVEICKLGKGGFASVFKARNKLDGIEYAIKKIRLRGGAKVRYEKIFREIKFLARLDHKNVIRYYSSWLEHADYPLSRREMYKGGGDGDELDTNGDLDDEYDDEYGDEDEYTNTMSIREELTTPGRLRRRGSVDYFGTHKEQHVSDPTDLSMGIVFGEDDDEEDDGIRFEDSQGPGDLEEEDDDGGLQDSDVASQVLLNGQGMGKTHSASSTLTSRNIPGISQDRARRQKHRSPTVSQELEERFPAWEESENTPSKTRGSLSNSYSALSSSIEEIQRSLPSSYSGLGSRYGGSRPKDRDLAALEDEHELRPFSFPDLRETKKDFMGGGLGGLHGLDRTKATGPQRRLRNSTGQLVTRDLTLFIQMQLCQTTLQDYLVYRNERPTAPSREPELVRKASKNDRFGILSSSAGAGDHKIHSAPGSPTQESNCHRDLVDPAANHHIFRAIVEGVAYIHAQDMIHRDLKPGNIFLGLPPNIELQRAQQLRQDHCNPSALSSTLVSTRGPSGLSNHTDFASTLLSRGQDECTLTKEQIQEELFVNIERMVPKIGDFGLVTDMEGGGSALDAEGSQMSTVSAATSASASNLDSISGVAPLLRRHSSSVTTGSRSSRTRTTAVGTVTYASPEQLARPNLGYDQKADIYSLGIIFFELYHPFSTLMERHAVLRTLRNGELPPDFVSRWPKEAAFVLWLMAEDPRLRPTAREILEFDLIRKTKETPQHHHHHHHHHHRQPHTNGSSSSSHQGGSQQDSHMGPKPAFTSSASVTPATPEHPGRKSNRDSGSGEQVSLDLKYRTADALCGLGLDSTPSTSDLAASEATKTMVACAACTARVICEDCQSRCRCKERTHGEMERADTAMAAAAAAAAETIITTTAAVDTAIPATDIPTIVKSEESNEARNDRSSGSKKHRPSKSMSSNKTSRSELEQRLQEEGIKVKRLEMSMEAMRAENRALLDKIQQLEYEKESFWQRYHHRNEFS